MKKVLSLILAVAAVIGISSCKTEATKAIEACGQAISAAVESGNWDEAIAAADAAYQQKDMFTAGNCANLACLYQSLYDVYTKQATEDPTAANPEQQLTYAQRIVDLYETGVASDADVFNSTIEANNMADLATIVEGYKTTTIPMIEEYVANGCQTQETVAEGDSLAVEGEAEAEEAVEEATEE